MQEVVGKYRLEYLKVKGSDTCNLLSNYSEKKGEEEGEEGKWGKYQPSVSLGRGVFFVLLMRFYCTFEITSKVKKKKKGHHAQCWQGVGI